MNGSDNRHMDEQLYVTLQRLRERADPADHQLIDTLAGHIDTLDERTRCAEQECERLRYKARAGQKRAEEALLKQAANERDKLRTLVDSIAGEVWFLDAEKNAVLLNPAVTRGLGFESEGDRPLDEILGSLEILDPDGTPRPQEKAPLYRSLQGEAISGEEIVRHLTTGELRYRRYRSSPVRDQAGSIIGAVAVVSDVTEDKLGKEELRTSLDRLALALDAIEAGVSFWDLKTDRMQWNPRQYELLGYAPGTVEPGLAALVDRVHPEDRQHVLATIDRSIREREDFTMEYRVCLPNGDVRWMHSVRRFAYDAAGRAVSSHGIMYDITDRKHHEAIRQQAYNQIEHNMEQFAILGDHVRHPLQVILARADLMEDEETAASIREQVKRINAIVRQLDRGWVESHAIREFLRRNDLA